MPEIPGPTQDPAATQAVPATPATAPTAPATSAPTPAPTPATAPTAPAASAPAPAIRLYPAIDLLDGQVVRLARGDYGQATVFSTDPFAQAAAFAQSGVSYLHVVDLNAARGDAQTNRALLLRLAAETPLKVQAGGGFRTLADIDEALASGIDRVVVGSALVKDPQMVAQAIHKHGQKIVAGIDARHGRVALAGWLEDTDVAATALAAQLAAVGLRHFVYTDINRDGLNSGVEPEAYVAMAAAAGAAIVASGGVSGPDDLRSLKALGPGVIEGVIVGRAYYDGRLDLREALQILEGGC